MTMEVGNQQEVNSSKNLSKNLNLSCQSNLEKQRQNHIKPSLNYTDQNDIQKNNDVYIYVSQTRSIY